jgi:hypothetical protein
LTKQARGNPFISNAMSTIDTAAFPDPGLHLLFPDGLRVDLSGKIIRETARRFLDDPERLPARVRAAADYQPCSICPMRETAEMCHAIMATLPFVDDMDRYVSYDAVTAVFREEGSGILHVAETTLQEALKYLGVLTLMHYCEVGHKYLAYFRGVIPLMPSEEIAWRVFHNLYFDCHGDIARIRTIVRRMQEEIQVTTRCQMARLRLICHNDAFLNALVAVNATAGWLDFDLAEMLASAEHGAP